MKQSELYDLPQEEWVPGKLFRRIAQASAERPFINFSATGESHSYGEIEQRAVALARGLAREDIKLGDFVCALLPNSIEIVCAYFAAGFRRAVFLPINTDYKGHLLDLPLAESECRLLIIHRSLIPSLATLEKERLKAIKRIVVVGGVDDVDLPGDAAQYVDYVEFVQDSGEDPMLDVQFHDLNSVSYTSGTTGPSKGVLSANSGIFYTARSSARIFGLEESDHLFAPFPLYYGVGMIGGVLTTMLSGAQQTIPKRFSATSFWEDVAGCGATASHTMFTIPPILKAKPPGPFDRAHKLRRMWNAKYDAEFEERFGPIILEGYGMMEAPNAVYNQYPARKTGTAGTLDDGWELQIVDDNDQPLPAGMAGEITLRPKLPYIVMQGYLKKPDRTVESWRNLWLHTGDLAKLNENGELQFVDRFKERIRRRGQNISSWDAEQFALKHPDVAEAAALAYPAPGGEDDLRIVVVLHEGASITPKALSEAFAGIMPRFMIPRYVEIRESLPFTPSGKIKKSDLVAEGLGMNVWDRETENV